MKIRLAIAADIPTLMVLEKQAATAAHWSQDQYERLFTDSGLPRLALIVEEEGGLQGFLVARATGPEWEIENVVVAEPARRQGLGSRLVEKIIDRARAHGAEAVFLEVRESNHAARALYEKCGFVESGRRTNYYRDPVEDAIVCRVTIS